MSTNLWLWSYRKQAYFISCKRFYEKFLYFFKRTRKKYNWFWKEKNVTVNKRTNKIKLRWKSMLYLWTKIFKRLYKNLNYWKIRDHCHYGGKYRDAAHSVCHLKFKLPHEISVIFHNGWVYDYYFSKKELANESEG